jgi:hypothetical protein
MGKRTEAKARHRAPCRLTCRRRGARCEIDHITPFDGTNTIAANLQCLCPRHHHLKHEAGWHVARAPDGTTHWTTPTGRKYDKPPDEIPGLSHEVASRRGCRGHAGSATS